MPVLHTFDSFFRVMRQVNEWVMHTTNIPIPHDFGFTQEIQQRVAMTSDQHLHYFQVFLVSMIPEVSEMS